MSASWAPDPTALALLERRGGPFGRLAFRQAWAAAHPEHRDLSHGARLPDGTQAAIALLSTDPSFAESLPYNYGGIQATRPLTEKQALAFLESARRAGDVSGVLSRDVGMARDGLWGCVGGKIAGWTYVLQLHPSTPVEPRLAKEARRSLRLARTAGAAVLSGTDPDGFLPLYGSASTRHWHRYPDDLIRNLAEAGAARFFDVHLDGERVSSAMALVLGDHWVWWLAAQNDRGREIHGNYLAVWALLEAARTAGVRMVNLGISTGMPGVAQFKRRFDALEVPVFHLSVGRLPMPRAGRRRSIRRLISGALRRIAG